MWAAKLANDFLNFPIQKITIQKSLQRSLKRTSRRNAKQDDAKAQHFFA
jgi:FixJ family two-component response regulator